MATVLMTPISVLLALPAIIAHLYGAGRGADVGREIHKSVWISLVLAPVAILLLCFPEPFDCDLAIATQRRNQGARLSRRIRLGCACRVRLAHFLRPCHRHCQPDVVIERGIQRIGDDAYRWDVAYEIHDRSIAVVRFMTLPGYV
jgi:hypothetical protein